MSQPHELPPKRGGLPGASPASLDGALERFQTRSLAERRAHVVSACGLPDILDLPREETTEQDVREALSIFESLGSRSFSLDLIRRRAALAAAAAERAHHRPLCNLILGCSEILLGPIAPLLARGAASELPEEPC